MGVDVARTKLTAYAFGACWAGLVGVIFAARNTYINPNSFTFLESALVLSIVVLGGMGSIPGSVIGGLAVGLIEASAGYLLSPQLKQAVWFTIFLAILVIRPNGLFGRATADTLEAR
jgi:branched-chain amino acid transport system permease protein